MFESLINLASSGAAGHSPQTAVAAVLCAVLCAALVGLFS